MLSPSLVAVASLGSVLVSTLFAAADGSPALVAVASAAGSPVSAVVAAADGSPALVAVAPSAGSLVFRCHLRHCCRSRRRTSVHDSHDPTAAFL